MIQLGYINRIPLRVDAVKLLIRSYNLLISQYQSPIKAQRKLYSIKYLYHCFSSQNIDSTIIHSYVFPLHLEKQLCWLQLIRVFSKFSPQKWRLTFQIVYTCFFKQKLSTNKSKSLHLLTLNFLWTPMPGPGL